MMAGVPRYNWGPGPDEAPPRPPGTWRDFGKGLAMLAGAGGLILGIVGAGYAAQWLLNALI